MLVKRYNIVIPLTNIKLFSNFKPNFNIVTTSCLNLTLKDSCVLFSDFHFPDELGDYDPEDHKEGYLSEFRIVPKQVCAVN